MGGAVPKEKPLPSEKATEIVAERQQTYGHPKQVYAIVGQLWSIYLAHRKQVVVELTPEDIAHMMLLLKEGREINQPFRDNRDDLAGYANVLNMVIE
jgi:Domain of unknown function (DUF6378)